MARAPDPPVLAAARPRRGLRGEAELPGDKSCAHRALILAALAAGRSEIANLPGSGDVRATAAVLRKLGAAIDPIDPGGTACTVTGPGAGALRAPGDVLDFANSGTSARLMSGVLAAHPFHAVLTGDASLRRRPMGRVIEPLRAMGAQFHARAGNRLPLSLNGTAAPLPLQWRQSHPSAQVKSAILLAGLHAPGQTSVIEPEPTRDHTERMLPAFGVPVSIRTQPDGAQAVCLEGRRELDPARIMLPGDPSSAAFLAAAAALVAGSQLRLKGICANPRRTGFYRALAQMGARPRFENRRTAQGEPVADLVIAAASRLTGIETGPGAAPAMIDEYPILAVLAACAQGPSRFRGLAELRAKESDRLAAIAAGLAANGVEAQIEGDDLTIAGCGGPPPGGGLTACHGDHRMAMAFLILGLAAQAPVRVDGGAMIATSFPSFLDTLRGLGGPVEAR